MAEEIKSSQTVETPAQPPAPVELGADVDNLLVTIPDLKDLFTGTPAPEPGKPAPEHKEGAAKPEPAAPELAIEDLIPEGLKPEPETPPAEKPKKDEEFSEKVQARIDELTAKRRTAEEKAAALETELTELKSKYQAPPPVAASPANPLADCESLQSLEQRKTSIEEAKNWAIKHLDGGKVSDGKGGEQYIDGAAVKEILANAEILLSKQVPAQREFLTNKAVFDREAGREYPALFKPGTEANKTFLQWLTVFPECRKYPDIALIIGDALVGQKIRMDRGKRAAAAGAPGNGRLPASAQQPLATPAPASSPRVPQNSVLSGDALRHAGDKDPEGTVDAFIASVIAEAAQRSR